MNKIPLNIAVDRFIAEYNGRYNILSAKVKDDEILCNVSNIKYINLIPLYYLGYKITIRE